jgi:hypothetical protein
MKKQGGNDTQISENNHLLSQLFLIEVFLKPKFGQYGLIHTL